MLNRKFAVFCALGVLLSSCYFSFDRDVKLINQFKSPGDIPVKVYFVQLGATTNDALNIFSYNAQGDSIFIGAYEHNYVKQATFLTKDSIQLVLSDSSSLYGLSQYNDTVRLNIFKDKDPLTTHSTL